MNLVEDRAAKKLNLDIIAKCQKAFDMNLSPREGDYIELPQVDERQNNMCRISHVWPDKVQTTQGGSFYASASGHMSYSGSLDPGIAMDALDCISAYTTGPVWIFDEGMAGAGRGVSMKMQFRVYSVKPGADTSGITSSRPPYFLNHLLKDDKDVWSLNKLGGWGGRLFDNQGEVASWLASNGYHVKDLSAMGYLPLYWPEEDTE